MNRTPPQPTSRQREQGFTLIEVLIVMATVGIVVGALAAAFSVIVRTSPDTGVRIDDARSTRGLATWLSHDTTSAPRFEPETAQGGFNLAASANACSGAGSNIIQMRWVENGLTTRTYVSNYRYVTSGTTAKVVRYTCWRNGVAGAYSNVASFNLTSGLNPTQPPIITLNRDGLGDVDSVTFTLTALSGEQVLVDTGPRNPTEFF